jgi:NADPH-dependent 2,4-dienoyl-CoA reductase/sulfur reductase-like enzyme
VKPPPKQNPISRTWNILSHDVRSIIDTELPPLLEFSTHVDVVIIGGGIMGSAIAHQIKQRTGKAALAVSVVEKDPSVSQILIRPK